MIENIKIVKMGTELFYGSKDPQKLKFSYDESQNIFSKTLEQEAVERAGLPWTGTFTYKEHFSNPNVKWHLFNLVSEILTAIIPKVITDQFDRFVETRNLNWGDQAVFEIGSPDLFTVNKVAFGNNSATRQRLDRRSLKLYPVMREVKIYDDLYRVLAGRLDWALWVAKVQMSLTAQIKTDIYNTIYNSYSGLEATYQASGSFSPATFNTLKEHVQASAGGLKPVCYGTHIALSKVIASSGFTGYPGLVSQSQMDEYNAAGYLGRFQGTDLIMLEQAHIPGTENFAISDQFLIIAASGAEKLVKLAFEGDVLVTENSNNRPADDSVEFSVRQAYDMGVLASSKYGIYQPS